MHVLFAVCEALYQVTATWLSARPKILELAAVMAVVAIFWCTWQVVILLFFTTNADPFSYRRVYGSISYDDGSLLAVPVRLKFVPDRPASDAKAYPPSGVALVDAKTGKFSAATTRSAGDGIVPGEHTVVLGMVQPDAVVQDVLPPEYLLFETSPLKVNTKNRPFTLKIKKPAPLPPSPLKNR